MYKKEFEKYNLIRQFEDKIVEIFPTDKIKSPVHLSYGQEMPYVLLSSFHNPGDKVYLTYRSHAGYLSYGGDPNKFMAELHGKSTGCSNGLGGSMHLMDLEKGIEGTSAVVSSHIPLALGDAYTKLNTNNVVTVYFGDGATEVGSFFESINVASLYNLPILFICENNGWADSSLIHTRRKIESISHYVKPWFDNHLSFTSFDNIRNNMLILKNVFDMIRKENKPIFIEYFTNREADHVGIENIKSEPLSYKKFNIDKQTADSIINNNIEKVWKAIDFAENSPFPEDLANSWPEYYT